MKEILFFNLKKITLGALCVFIVAVVIFLSGYAVSLANGLSDADGDGVPDRDEIEIYQTDPNNPDTDGDGFSDRAELITGFSPLTKEKLKLEDADYDQDGLSDRLELNFHTNLKNPDTDGDGFSDGVEINSGYNPLSLETIKLPKRIEINTGSEQKISYFLGGVKLGDFSISSGLPSMPTPKGHYKIESRALKAWSPYGLWMPYWMALVPSGRFGIHELPIWPSGYREGEDHLGHPVSHGCVRVGQGSAKFLYDWAEIGTPVFIY